MLLYYIIMLFLIKSAPLQTVVMAIQIGEKMLYVLSILLTLVTAICSVLKRSHFQLGNSRTYQRLSGLCRRRGERGAISIVYAIKLQSSMKTDRTGPFSCWKNPKKKILWKSIQQSCYTYLSSSPQKCIRPFLWKQFPQLYWNLSGYKGENFKIKK